MLSAIKDIRRTTLIKTVRTPTAVCFSTLRQEFYENLVSFENCEKKSTHRVQAQRCSSNRLDLRSKWREEVLFENRRDVRAS